MKTFLNALTLLLGAVAGSIASDKTVIRVGHFPNITHAQGLVAHNLSRQGKGWFEARLGPGVEIQWFVYNAGPSAMEAIFARSIELAQVRHSMRTLSPKAKKSASSQEPPAAARPWRLGC
jgi:sulfonate transport system substrate-binding protein